MIAGLYEGLSDEDRERFEYEEKDMNDCDRKTDQTGCISETASRFFPDDLQHRVVIGLAQEHEVPLESDIDEIHDDDQDKDFDDRRPDTRIIHRDLVGCETGNDIGDDQTVVKELVYRVEIESRKRGGRRENDGHDGSRQEQKEQHLPEKVAAGDEGIQTDEVRSKAADLQRQVFREPDR